MKGAIIYISSNKEDPKFEGKIFKEMYYKKGNLPVYIVSQKPMDAVFEAAQILFVGKQEVIGDVGASGFNFCRQLQKVVAITKADYVISCEADCLYSPDYFAFVPPKLGVVYRNTNNYVLPYQKNYWYPKKSQTAFQIADRNFLLHRLDYLLKGQPEWDTKMKNFPKEIGESFLEGWDTFETRYACFGIKTGQGMRNHTASGREKVYELPYWGTASSIRKDYL